MDKMSIEKFVFAFKIKKDIRKLTLKPKELNNYLKMATYRYTKFVDKTNPRKQRRFIKKAEVDNLYLYYKNIAVTDCCT